MPKNLLKLPPLNTLVVFEAAYRLGNFTQAASELALSQASVSRRVRELESDLGVPLFERRRYDVIPTAHGETLATTVRNLLSELSVTADRLRAYGANANRLTLFSDLSLSSALISPVIGEFQRRYPELQLRVLSSYEPIDAVQEHFDLGLHYGRRAEERFFISPIADEAVFPVCSPEFAATLPASISAKDLSRLPLLHLSDVDEEWVNWERFLRHFGVNATLPIGGTEFGSYQTALDVAQSGEGIALGWSWSVQSKLNAGQLVRISSLTMSLPNSINVYFPRRDTPNAIANELLALICARMQDARVSIPHH